MRKSIPHQKHKVIISVMKKYETAFNRHPQLCNRKSSTCYKRQLKQNLQDSYKMSLARLYEATE